jgi:hypothetical protein
VERRTALAISASVVATACAVGAAFATNVGLLRDEADPVGRLQVSSVSELIPTTTAPTGVAGSGHVAEDDAEAVVPSLPVPPGSSHVPPTAGASPSSAGSGDEESEDHGSDDAFEDDDSVDFDGDEDDDAAEDDHEEDEGEEEDD